MIEVCYAGQVYTYEGELVIRTEVTIVYDDEEVEPRHSKEIVIRTPDAKNGYSSLPADWPPYGILEIRVNGKQVYRSEWVAYVYGIFVDKGSPKPE